CSVIHQSRCWSVTSVCPLRADCVAKLLAALRERNNRISPNCVLNQCCVSAFVLESILLVWVVKLVLQHNRQLPDIDACPTRCPPPLFRQLSSYAAMAVISRQNGAPGNIGAASA